MPESSQVDWFIYRPILAKVTTFSEIDNCLSLCDLLDFHEALDIREEIEAKASRPSRKR